VAIVPGIAVVGDKMGDSQTIMGLVLAGMAIVAGIATLVLMVLLHRELAKQSSKVAVRRERVVQSIW
jgi:hypothetical protein